jgi:dCMP deaminase
VAFLDMLPRLKTEMNDSERVFMGLAYWVAQKSPDRSTQNGVVLLSHRFSPSRVHGLLSKADIARFPDIVVGCNEFPPNVDPNDDSNHVRERKYPLIVHAERNVVYAAARRGLNTRAGTMFAAWAACPGCAQAIIQSGIQALYVHRDRLEMTPERWQADVDLGLNMLLDNGVQVIPLSGSLGDGTTIMFDGSRIEV